MDDPYEFARVQAFNAYLCSTVHVAHAHMRRGERWADDPSAIAEMKRKAPEVMDACFRLLASDMVAGPWVMGERYSIADPYLFTITQWLPSDGLDSASYPVIHEHAQRMLERPAVRDALTAEAAG